MSDFYGNPSVKALMVDHSATWCPDCQQESSELPQVLSPSSPAAQAGVNWIILMWNGGQGVATIDDVTNWRGHFGLAGAKAAVVLDEPGTILPAGQAALPLNSLVDTATMKIVKIWPGYAPDLADVVKNWLASGKPPL
jgi:hypothetical protein